jgi:hypothetical protein
MSYFGTLMNPYIMMGRAYYALAGTPSQVRCVDLNTGRIIWTQPGVFSLGWHTTASDLTGMTAPGTPTAYYWGISGTTWTQYDAYSGTPTKTITNAPSGLSTKWTDGRPIVYCLQQGTWSVATQRRSINALIMWNLTQVANNDWSTGVVWNVSLKQADGTGPGEGGRASGIILSDDYSVLCVHSVGEDLYYGYNMNTGAMVYKKSCGFPEMNAGYWSAHGTLTFAWNSQTMTLTAIDVKTGNIQWTSEVAGNYPWGSNTGIYSADMTNVYILSFDGHCYAVDLKSGKINWSFFVGNTTETVFGNWACRLNVKIADGKCYFFTSEHSPTQPRIRGNKLFCVNTTNGAGIWNISSAISPGAISSGYMFGGCEDDGCLYCFGKGQSATTIRVQNDVIAKGASVLIQGTVMDMSPAQPNTPAIADQDQGPWMSYLHLQQPMPTNVHGVPVMLTATAPDGSAINIGSTTSDGYGNFYYDWTPPNTGIYKVQATFAGSESYSSSTAEAAVSVKASTPTASVNPSQPNAPSSPSSTTSPSVANPSSPATSPPSASTSPSVAPPPSSEAAPSMTLYIAIVAAIAVIAVVAALVAFKLRK